MITSTTTTPDVSTLAQAFATRYSVVSIDFLWTAITGFEDFTVYASTAEAGVLSIKVPAFDYNRAQDDADIRELLMTALDEAEIITNYSVEFGGTLLLDGEGEHPQLKGNVTESSPVSFSF